MTPDRFVDATSTPRPAIPKPSFEKTYRHADGEAVGNEFGWVTDLDYFDDYYDPVELIEESWVRMKVRRFWHLPATLYDCDLLDCDEDAVAWEPGPDGIPRQVCEVHREIWR